ncbi:MAG: hypothetical protein PUH24_01525 [Prevotellaceae bacterium]|nr:hypothetical protein [Prevotella sp.]MDD7256958.1 hypothetical protein [Prevotellaceae bacterium]MDY6131397.1 hypothetical protein [Prevotella sp.]
MPRRELQEEATEVPERLDTRTTDEQDCPSVFVNTLFPFFTEISECSDKSS